jgi:acyl-CoA thioester hydrolase
MSAAGEPPQCWSAGFGIYFDDLDLNGHLHNARLVVLVERAQTALFESLGGAWSQASDRHEDLRYVVRELHLEFLAPVSAPGRIEVGMQALRIGRTSAVYGFRCHFEGTDVDIATGHRAIVKVDGAGRPAAWTQWYRDVFASLQTGTLPAGTS